MPADIAKLTRYKTKLTRLDSILTEAIGLSRDLVAESADDEELMAVSRAAAEVCAYIVGQCGSFVNTDPQLSILGGLIREVDKIMAKVR